MSTNKFMVALDGSKNNVALILKSDKFITDTLMKHKHWPKKLTKWTREKSDWGWISTDDDSILTTDEYYELAMVMNEYGFVTTITHRGATRFQSTNTDW